MEKDCIWKRNWSMALAWQAACESIWSERCSGTSVVCWSMGWWNLYYSWERIVARVIQNSYMDWDRSWGCVYQLHTSGKACGGSRGMESSSYIETMAKQRTTIQTPDDVTLWHLSPRVKGLPKQSLTISFSLCHLCPFFWLPSHAVIAKDWNDFCSWLLRQCHWVLENGYDYTSDSEVSVFNSCVILCVSLEVVSGTIFVCNGCSPRRVPGARESLPESSACLCLHILIYIF